ncbi:hypothetical protein fugu_001588 [Takifugu bimaculatus]|uniref:Progestin and adipoQ receptor family member 9 n=1 Tax=Takifugu bimaculatus TaxID=433685 RepID=A0A4Z2BNC7_9TELE|nr:hypothetical protein fugu_001588 [Takifugu bimaculatus]
MLLRCSQPLPLLKHTDVPPRVIENFILSGYRFPNYSLKDCFLSAFRPTNETGNFWTHFVPVFIFSYHFVEVFGWEGAPPSDAPFFYPLWTYFIGVFCLLMGSSMAHLLNSMSLVVREVCFFVDYGTISAYTVGSSLAYFYYIHPRAGLLDTVAPAGLDLDQDSREAPTSAYAIPQFSVFFETFYIPSACIVAIVCVLSCSITRQKWRKHRYMIRTLVFLLPLLVSVHARLLPPPHPLALFRRLLLLCRFDARLRLFLAPLSVAAGVRRLQHQQAARATGAGPLRRLGAQSPVVPLLHLPVHPERAVHDQGRGQGHPAQPRPPAAPGRPVRPPRTYSSLHLWSHAPPPDHHRDHHRLVLLACQLHLRTPARPASQGAPAEMSLTFCGRGLQTEPHHTETKCSCSDDVRSPEVEGGLIITTSVGPLVCDFSVSVSVTAYSFPVPVPSSLVFLLPFFHLSDLRSRKCPDLDNVAETNCWRLA